MSRIACLIDSISQNAGGLSPSLRGMMSEMQREGDDVRIFSVADEHAHEVTAEWSGFDVCLARSKGPRKFGYAPSLNCDVEEFEPDVLHVHGLWTYTSVVGMSWRRRTGRPTVIHPHGMLDVWALKNSRWKKQLAMLLFEHRHLAGASCIRVLCHAEEEAVRALGFKNPVSVIPNGVDLPKGEKSGQNVAAATRKILLYLGRIHPKKGIVPLIEAFAQKSVGTALSDWTLIVAGWDQDSHESELKCLASRLGMEWSDLREASFSEAGIQSALQTRPRLIFAGPAFGTDKERLYRMSSAFILPSFSEGLPMVVLEAWSYGKPVLMTPMCNLPEGVASGAAVSIFPSVESIGEKLEMLAGLPADERWAMGARGHDLVERQFTWGRVASQMREVDQWLLRKGVQPNCVRTIDS